MNRFSLPESFIYKHRYVLGYTAVALALIGVIVFLGLYLPGGITNAEMQSAVHSSSLRVKDWASLDIVNFPYYFLQKIGFSLFGVSILTIKLPSMIIAFLSAVGLILLLKRWFRSNVAILASLIAITTGQFLFIAQNGTPDIMFIFWSIWILLLASLISAERDHQIIYAIVLFAFSALSLYTPLGIYPLIVLLTVTFIHPHVRHALRKLPKHRLLPGLIAAIIVLAPLIFYCIKSPKTILTLLGVPSSFNLQANLATVASQYFNFMHPGGTISITPFFELGSALLILLGFYRIFQARVAAKCYTIFLLFLCAAILVILNPGYTAFSFLPLVLLLAAGINWLFIYWYGLFPFNPYARIAGLIPIVALAVILVFSGLSRYVYSYEYDAGLVYSFSNDIALIPSDTKHLVVSKDELEFYKVLQKYNGNFDVSLVAPTNGEEFLSTRQAKIDNNSTYRIFQIITNSKSNYSDRFYLYQKTSK